MDEHLQEIVNVLGNLWDKYAVDFGTIEQSRGKATSALGKHLGVLGYD
jgi:hypothetical protein